MLMTMVVTTTIKKMLLRLQILALMLTVATMATVIACLELCLSGHCSYEP